ncbi:MAG: replicative DNA helicase [Verrucomicrobia bacterium GWF2_62_7]|nr:MAG: replicative DNA helicase [Verrucomicrobia bacterium GWF2_62_7]
MGRSLPHSDDAERCLLGSLLLNPPAISECIEKFASKDPKTRGGEYFYNENHGLIYRTLVDMQDEHEPVDLMTVTQKLAGRNQLERVGGAVAITQLSNAVPTAGNLEFYLNIVRQRYRLRQLIEAGTQIVTESYGTLDEGVDDFVDHVERLVFDIAQEKSAHGVVSGADVVKEAVHEIDDILQHKGKLRGISTGFTELDKCLDGLQRGSMIVIAARPSMGKTSLAMNIAEHVAILNSENPMPVGVFSLEMPAVQLIIRMLCSVGEVSMNRIRRGLSTDVEYKSLINSAKKISNAKILIDDTGDLTIMELRAKARRMKANHDIQLLVVDYLQLMRAPMRGNYDNRQQEIAAISGGLKALAKELKIPVMVLSQLNREAEKREGGRPRLSDLRESGAIEQDADVVALIAPKDDRKDEEVVAEEITQAVLIIAKNRNGPQGKIPLQFRRDITRFFSAAIEESDVAMTPREETM